MLLSNRVGRYTRTAWIRFQMWPKQPRAMEGGTRGGEKRQMFSPGNDPAFASMTRAAALPSVPFWESLSTGENFPGFRTASLNKVRTTEEEKKPFYLNSTD